VRLASTIASTGVWAVVVILVDVPYCAKQAIINKVMMPVCHTVFVQVTIEHVLHTGGAVAKIVCATVKVEAASQGMPWW